MSKRPIDWESPKTQRDYLIDAACGVLVGQLSLLMLCLLAKATAFGAWLYPGIAALAVALSATAGIRRNFWRIATGIAGAMWLVSFLSASLQAQLLGITAALFLSGLVVGYLRAPAH